MKKGAVCQTAFVRNGKVNSDMTRHYDVIDVLFASLNLRDPTTAEHSILMAEYSFQLASIFDSKNADLYYVGGLTHDIGKLGMDDNILKSNRRLSSDERTILHRHVEQGTLLLTQLGLPEVVINIARYHHERYNGSGYLMGLQGDDIPLVGRISAIADTYSAMIADRPYQKNRTHNEVIYTMMKEKHLFDATILDTFCTMTCIESRMINSWLS